MNNQPRSITLFCWILDVSNRSFPVDIDDSRTVGHLKEEILAKKSTTFAAIEDQLEIRKVSIPTTPTPTNDIVKQRFLDADLLDETEPLSDVFRDGPARRTIHVVIQSPHIFTPGQQSHQLLELNCLLNGDDSTHVFPITIAGTASVGALKEIIKDKKKPVLDHVTADSLTLRKVSIPDDDGFEDNVRKAELTAEKLLQPMKTLNEIFSEPPMVRHLHLVVRCEEPNESRAAKEKGKQKEWRRDQISTLELRREKVISGVLKALSPSDSAKSSALAKSQTAYSIHDGRYKAGSPRTVVAPPVELFHPAFGHFRDDIKKNDPIPEDIIRNTTTYMKEASAIYTSERARREKLDPLLVDILGVNIPSIANLDKTCPDGVVESLEGIGLVSYGHKEDKNEKGDGDSSAQVVFTFSRCICQSKFTNVRNATCCPSFLIATAGPWIVILGAVITDTIIAQRLTDSVWVGLDSALSESRISHVARVFYALRMGLERLHGYYRDLEPIGDERLSTRFFPSITSFYDGNHIVNFEYVGYLEDDLSCTTLRARTCTEPARDIVVKFSERYGERAHRLLAEKGLAPKLLDCGKPGDKIEPTSPSYEGLNMAVMEYVVGHTLAVAKGEMTDERERQVHEDVKRALELLHETGLVYGDLRPPNIVVPDTTDGVRFIDFDWAGVEGQVRYPSLISPSVKWPDGVKGLDIIKPEHDTDMLSRLLD